MPQIAIFSNEQLSKTELGNQLRALRLHSLHESSNFAVSVLLEFKVKDRYVYIGGVNVENDENNRLSLHAEQNAIAAARALLGSDAIFTRVFPMGGPKEVGPGKDPRANVFIDLCGHCRQILLPFAAENNKRHMVTINGAISDGKSIQELLPNAFSDKGLKDEKYPHPLPMTLFNSKSKAPFSPLYFFTRDVQPNLDHNDIHSLLQTLLPKLIDPQWETSKIRTCILKINSRYVPGVLMQDAAFLPTTALHAALGFGITSMGLAKLNVQEVHLYGLPNAKLEDNELGAIRRFAQNDVPIHFYTSHGLARSYNLTVYKQEQDKAWLEKYAPMYSVLLSNSKI